MDSFQAKIGWNSMRKREKIKIIVPSRSNPTTDRNSKKIVIKFKKLKSTITDSFQAIIGWKMIRNRENKNYRSISFLPDA